MVLNETVILEQEILGGILNNNALLEDCKTFINEDMFMVNSHKAIYRELHRLINEGHSIDVINLIQHLKDDTSKLGGVNYLYEVSECCPSEANFKSKIDIMISNYQNYRMKEMAKKILGESDTEKNRTTLEEGLTNVNNCCNVSVIDPGQEGSRYLENFEKKMKGEKSGISSGLFALDKKIKNLRPGKLITIQARSSVGKTVFALQIAQNVALNKGNVFYSTGEMDEDEVRDRIMASRCGIDYDRIMAGELEAKEFVNVATYTDMLARTNFHVSEETNFYKTINEIKLYIQKYGKLDLLVLDYIDLYTDGVPGDNETQRLGYISRNIKKLARKYKFTALLLVQTKRTVDKENKNNEVYEKVESSDIQGSAKIEQDSDIIIGLYRNTLFDDAMARKHLPIDKSSMLADLNPDIINAIITKGRDCQKGTLAFVWEGKYQRILNVIR